MLGELKAVISQYGPTTQITLVMFEAISNMPLTADDGFMLATSPIWEGTFTLES